MKTELQLLKEWIEQQKNLYSITNFETPEKKLEAIERMLTLNEVMLQIDIFETLCTEHFLRVNFPSGKKQMIDELADARYTNQPHISTGLPYTNLNK